MKQFDLYVGHDLNGHTEHELGCTVRDAIKAHCDVMYPAGYTLIDAQGCWQGGREDTTIVRLILDERVAGTEDKVRRLAGDLKAALWQEAVMVVTTTVDADFV